MVSYAPIFCSVGISDLQFLHINANLTNMLLIISCVLEAMDQQVAHSHCSKKLVACLMKKLPESRTPPSMQTISSVQDSSSHGESTIDLFRRICSLLNR